MNPPITFRALIEVIGKPKEHVEGAIKEYVTKIKADKKFIVLEEELAEGKKHTEEGMWATFAELEIKTNELKEISRFCFEYMPSLIEIIEPEKLTLSDVDISLFISDLQTHLHNADMIAKQLKIENEHLKRNSAGLLKNFVLVLLRAGPLTLSELCSLTGVDNEQKMGDFCDKLIDEKKIDLKNSKYSLHE
ncbi:hypothetical protein HYV86_06150 [Candidatus Woesearchaeota archaeon]|nr:hypothetical protein [Candidatus Woesearchaeota archaeon]